MKVYLDVCCLNRPFDDLMQDRIRLEAEAVILILGHFEAADWQWLGSEAVDVEVAQTPDEERKKRDRLIIEGVDTKVQIEAEQAARAQELVKLGFHAVDALHLACAERGGADIFLTTDDRLLRRAVRFSKEPRVQVANSLEW
jgi:predicted nucleic acid-binding protein